jgi:hypothetical protein
LRRVVFLDQADQRRYVQKLVLHEHREVVGDLVLVLRNDRGVRGDDWNRHAAKQRDHGEPVGQRADHGGLGYRLDAVHPEAARHEGGHEENAGGSRQQQ